ncbi:MAG: 1,4-alpha-glucan branching protein GlgB [Candidatus Pelethousia sp.]|nr:1,4-alpha-glucan branching protein GlgB [Candidatus Pelethousia sp.]
MNEKISQKDLYLWGEGTNIYAYMSLGCHAVKKDGHPAFRFAVWAPNAQSVSVVGSFNGWNPEADPMEMCGTTGVWQAFIGIAHEGDTYKYAIRTSGGELLYKADPFAFASQLRPNTASVIWDIGGYDWNDGVYMARRAVLDHHSAPINIYELHPGSWKLDLGFDELSEELVRYVADMGYTHIELMPVCEYPLDDSWGYQVTGYYSITARYGTPQQFKHFVDACHQSGIGVILDWVPAHFARDEQGLRRFDGTPLYEHPDPRRSDQPQWGTLLFNYEKNEVRSFLISNAMYFLREYHIDGLRVDAVSCMLYLDYGREGNAWLPNRYGGRENLGAIAMFRALSIAVRQEAPGALLIAEESTAFPDVTAPPEEGGLGFDYKWNMGWMNDTLSYMSMDSLFRKWHHDQVTFSMCYAFSERYILPLSHDEVVHGKCSLIGRMPGEYEDKFRQLRLLLMYQFAHPGKKLNFMGGEFGQFIEWDFRRPLDWFLLSYPSHGDMQLFTRQLNRFYARTPALYEQDDDWQGFEWLAADDNVHSILVFIRRDSRGGELLCAFNFTPVKHDPYRIPLPQPYVLTQALSNVDLREISGVLSEQDEYGGEYVDIMLSPYEAVYYYLKPQRRPAAAWPGPRPADPRYGLDGRSEEP